jgi:biotin carboxyl carrier protein
VTDEAAARDGAGAGPDDAMGVESLTGEVLPALIARLRAGRLGELEVRTADWRVRLRRDPAARLPGPSASVANTAAAVEEAPVTSVARSPAVGYFSPAPQLTVGLSVSAGDVLGSIDVLGIAQEVVSPADGIVASILAEDGQAVEYGQALADIDPLGMVLAVGDVPGQAGA